MLNPDGHPFFIIVSIVMFVSFFAWYVAWDKNGGKDDNDR